MPPAEAITHRAPPLPLDANDLSNDYIKALLNFSRQPNVLCPPPPFFFFFSQSKWPCKSNGFLMACFLVHGCCHTCCEWLGLLLHVNSCYLGKMPDVNYSEVDFVNCTQDTLPGGRFILHSTRGVCAGWQTRPLGIGLAHQKTNKQAATLALPVNTRRNKILFKWPNLCQHHPYHHLKSLKTPSLVYVNILSEGRGQGNNPAPHPTPKKNKNKTKLGEINGEFKISVGL